MPKIDVRDPAVAAYYTENFERAKKLRRQWIQKNIKAVEKAATFLKEPKNNRWHDVLETTILGSLTSFSKDYKISACNHRKKVPHDVKMPPSSSQIKCTPPIVELPELESRTNPLINMRPADKEVTKWLYMHRPKYGRKKYLAERGKIKPEDKYYLPETRNWNYGWRLQDSMLSRNYPQCGRLYVLSREFEGSTGPQPDAPLYHRLLEKPGVSKCLK